MSSDPADLSGIRSPFDAADLPRLSPVRDGEVEPAPEQPRRAWVEQIMGMPISITVRGPGLDARPGPRPVEDAVAAAFASLRRVDEVFSTWKPDSQVSRVRRGELDLAGCDADVREVAALCTTAREATGGWFDADLPDPTPEAPATRRWDPTGLVKGWAVARAARDLSAALDGYDVLVNAGGDLAAHCRRTDTPDWVIAIEDPRDRSAVLASVPLRVGGVATSGTAARGAHILDPHTGAAVQGALASVSVIGPDLLWADVWATAAFAEGPACVERLRRLTDHAWLVVDAAGTVTTSAG